jgi:hypothetical protein
MEPELVRDPVVTTLAFTARIVPDRTSGRRAKRHLLGTHWSHQTARERHAEKREEGGGPDSRRVTESETRGPGRRFAARAELHFARRARERPRALASDSSELHGVVLPPALLAATFDKMK